MLLIQTASDHNAAECHSLDEILFSVYSQPTADINRVQAQFFLFQGEWRPKSGPLPHLCDSDHNAHRDEVVSAPAY